MSYTRPTISDATAPCCLRVCASGAAQSDGWNLLDRRRPVLSLIRRAPKRSRKMSLKSSPAMPNRCLRFEEHVHYGRYDGIRKRSAKTRAGPLPRRLNACSWTRRERAEGRTALDPIDETRPLGCGANGRAAGAEKRASSAPTSQCGEPTRPGYDG